MEEEGEKAGRRCSKLLKNIGTCVWGAPATPMAGGENSREAAGFQGAESQCEISALRLPLTNARLT